MSTSEKKFPVIGLGLVWDEKHVVESLDPRESSVSRRVAGAARQGNWSVRAVMGNGDDVIVGAGEKLGLVAPDSILLMSSLSLSKCSSRAHFRI